MYDKSDQHYEQRVGTVPNFCGCMGPMYGEPLCPCAMRTAGLPMSKAHVTALETSQEEMKKLTGFFQMNRNKKEEN